MSAFKSGLVSTQHFWPAARSVSLKTKQIKSNRFQRRSKSVTQLRKLLSPFWTPSMSGITALRKWASAGFRRRAEREGIITTAIAAATCNPPSLPHTSPSLHRATCERWRCLLYAVVTGSTTWRPAQSVQELQELGIPDVMPPARRNFRSTSPHPTSPTPHHPTPLPSPTLNLSRKGFTVASAWCSLAAGLTVPTELPR